MADVYAGVFEDIGEDFLAAAGGLANVTFRRINADTGATVSTVNNVPALKRVRSLGTVAAGEGGGVPGDRSRFVMALESLDAARTLIPRARDQIVEADGATWDVADSESDVQVIGFGRLVAVNVTRSTVDTVS